MLSSRFAVSVATVEMPRQAAGLTSIENAIWNFGHHGFSMCPLHISRQAAGTREGLIVQQSIYLFVYLAFGPAWPVCSLPSVCEVQGQLNALMDGLLLFCFIRDFVSSIFCPVETFFASQPKSRQHNLTTILPLVKGSMILALTVLLHYLNIFIYILVQH